jgi:hypothetical protein
MDAKRSKPRHGQYFSRQTLRPKPTHHEVGFVGAKRLKERRGERGLHQHTATFLVERSSQSAQPQRLGTANDGARQRMTFGVQREGAEGKAKEQYLQVNA